MKSRTSVMAARNWSAVTLLPSTGTGIAGSRHAPSSPATWACRPVVSSKDAPPRRAAKRRAWRKQDPFDPVIVAYRREPGQQEGGLIWYAIAPPLCQGNAMITVLIILW